MPRHLERLQQFFEDSGQPLQFIDFAAEELAAHRSDAACRAWATRRARRRDWIVALRTAKRRRARPGLASSGRSSAERVARAFNEGKRLANPVRTKPAPAMLRAKNQGVAAAPSYTGVCRPVVGPYGRDAAASAGPDGFVEISA